VFNYGRLQRICDVTFVFFAIIFYVSRLVIYPGWYVEQNILYYIDYIPCSWCFFFVELKMFYKSTRLQYSLFKILGNLSMCYSPRG
jgi:hypothetical protein